MLWKQTPQPALRRSLRGREVGRPQPPSERTPRYRGAQGRIPTGAQLRTTGKAEKKRHGGIARASTHISMFSNSSRFLCRLKNAAARFLTNRASRLLSPVTSGGTKSLVVTRSARGFLATLVAPTEGLFAGTTEPSLEGAGDAAEKVCFPP